VEETGSDTERIKTRHRSRSPHAQIIRTTRFEDRSAHNSGTINHPYHSDNERVRASSMVAFVHYMYDAVSQIAVKSAH
ncbi:MAG: hypothetical protein ABSB35_42715, partial [Bryobacteraceae bacterium]